MLLTNHPLRPSLYVDPKADVALDQQLQSMLARSTVFQNECKRYGARFLPKQVLRPAFANAGLQDGPFIKPHTSDWLALRF